MSLMSFDRPMRFEMASAAAARAGRLTVSLLTWPFRVLRAQRELAMLASMTEVELKDIGLTRMDLGDATALPADASPTRFLAGRVDERFRARQH